MTTIDNIMALHDEAVEKRHINGAPVYNAVAAHAREALRTALTEALEKDVSLIGEGTKAQPIDTSGERVEKIVGTVQVQKVLIERALQAISASILGTDTYRVSRRGDFASTVEKELRSALAQPVREPLNKSEWPKHPSAYVNDEYMGYSKSDLDSYAMQVLRSHGIGGEHG